jgi:hypothetical protein
MTAAAGWFISLSDPKTPNLTDIAFDIINR